MTLKIGALFAGMGGLDEAVQMVVPSEVAWVSEIEKGPCKVLAHHYPDAPNHGDVTKIDWTKVEPVDIITGGTPCQDLSTAGQRRGMNAGTRSGLWASMCDAIETIRPSLVVWENVRGALSATATSGDVESCEFCVGDDGQPSLRALGRVLGDLSELGYDAGWVGLRAADLGAPHARYRIFVVAWPAAGDADSIGMERVRPAGVTVTDQNAGAPLPVSAGALPAWGSAEWKRLNKAVQLLPTPAVNDMGEGKTLEWWDEWAPRQKSASGAPAPHGKSLAVEAMRLADAGHYGTYGDAVTQWASVIGRQAPDSTERTKKDGSPELSARFVEFMMGLPDGWVTDPAIGLSRNEQLKALGNGVVPQQCAEAIRYLLNQRAQQKAPTNPVGASAKFSV